MPRSEKVTTNVMKTSYSSSAGTALVFFDEAIVPAENIFGEYPHTNFFLSFLFNLLPGPEHGGLVVILANFNHERWMMTCNTVRIERAIVEECFQ